MSWQFGTWENREEDEDGLSFILLFYIALMTKQQTDILHAVYLSLIYFKTSPSYARTHGSLRKSGRVNQREE